MYTILYTQTHTHNHARTVCKHYGDRGPLCTYSMHSTMHNDIIEINNTKHYPDSKQILFNSAPWYFNCLNTLSCRSCCINTLYNIRVIWSCDGLTVNNRVWITFSVVLRDFILRQNQLQCATLVCNLHSNESFFFWSIYLWMPYCTLTFDDFAVI